MDNLYLLGLKSFQFDKDFVHLINHASLIIDYESMDWLYLFEILSDEECDEIVTCLEEKYNFLRKGHSRRTLSNAFAISNGSGRPDM